ncbi:hypothetical protein [Paenibacillus faecalis]|uniref:hypothetical protein n=1 Tax=Paenibacillus faecalis TaxID=2079532 RepID=UPI000D1031CC|nr:hypothetical protein [Paenibacillus faecalis]
MSKIIDFIKTYIRISKKKYLYHSIQFLIIGLIFHLVFYNLWEMKYMKQTLESAEASNLYVADFSLDDPANLDMKLEKMQKELPSGVNIIAPVKKSAFTDQRHDNTQVTVHFLSQNEIEQYNYSVSNGDYFGNEPYREHIYPAIIPEQLSNKYKIGEIYDITINKSFKPLQSIQVKIIGSRKDNYILELFNSPNIYKRDSTLLIYDVTGELSRSFYEADDNRVPIVIKNDTSYSESSFISLLEDDGLDNISNLETEILRKNGLTYNDIYLYITLLIVFIPLIIVSLASFLYLEFQNKKRELYIYRTCGIDPYFYSLSMFILNVTFFAFPILLQELLWFLICLMVDIKFIWPHSLALIGISIFTVVLITVFQSYFISKVKYDEKFLD